MPSVRWLRLIAVLCGMGSAVTGVSAWSFQYPPLSDDINTRHLHNPDAWVGGEFRTSGGINQSPAEFGPAPGMWSRSPGGVPASGDRFPLMTPGPLPGGLSPHGFNGSGMRPPVNQPAYIANNPLFGGNGQAPFGTSQPAGWASQGPNGAMDANQSNGVSFPPLFNGQPGANLQNPTGSMNPNAFGQGPAGQPMPPGWSPPGNPFGPPQLVNANRQPPKVSWALDSATQPYVGLLGQVARPGVYEVEQQGTRLGDLIQEIGGLARDASGQFRIIRNGRPGQMTSYSGAAHFELMPGDLVIADSQPGAATSHASRATTAAPSSDTAVQIGFVNLIDRPVVLKLRREHASLVEILALMRQDESLAAQIRVVAPPHQRSAGPARPDVALSSGTVLIFPQNTVRAARLAPLPEPYKLKRENEPAAPQPDPQRDPPTNISPDVTQSPRRQPAVGAWQDSTPLPQAAQPVAQPQAEPSPETADAPPPPDELLTAPRPAGVRGAPRGQSRIARDSQMVLAPPAEPADNAAAPEPVPTNDSSEEPSLLETERHQRPIKSANDAFTAADLDETEASANTANPGWSIWPPILTACVGLLALIGYSLSLRRRTKATQTLPMPAMIATAPVKPTRRDALDAIINDQLPLTEEQVPLTSPMQFHGRPQPPLSIRLDQSHSLPQPHLETNVRAQRSGIRGQKAETRTPPVSAPKTATTATQKFRIDRAGATGTGTQILSGTAPSQPDAGPLDRALSAVQKTKTPAREERGA
jgi:hypothetical protein